MTPLHILYQDDFLVAIDKPAGMIVHPGREPEGPQWIAMKRLRDQLDRQVFPIHRLDRPTSGVLLFALDKQSAGLAQQAFELRNVTKTYHAIVCGIAPQKWICETPLRKNPEGAPLAAQTSFERLASTPESSFPAEPTLRLSLLKATPATGRFTKFAATCSKPTYRLSATFATPAKSAATASAKSSAPARGCSCNPKPWNSGTLTAVPFCGSRLLWMRTFLPVSPPYLESAPRRWHRKNRASR